MSDSLPYFLDGQPYVVTSLKGSTQSCDVFKPEDTTIFTDEFCTFANIAKAPGKLMFMSGVLKTAVHWCSWWKEKKR